MERGRKGGTRPLLLVQFEEQTPHAILGASAVWAFPTAAASLARRSPRAGCILAGPAAPWLSGLGVTAALPACSLRVDRELAADVDAPHHEDVVALSRVDSRGHGRVLGKGQEVARREVQRPAEVASAEVVGQGGGGLGGEAAQVHQGPIHPDGGAPRHGAAACEILSHAFEGGVAATSHTGPRRRSRRRRRPDSDSNRRGRSGRFGEQPLPRLPVEASKNRLARGRLAHGLLHSWLRAQAVWRVRR